MNRDVTFGAIVKERRNLLGLTQAELGRRVGCAAITIRKIEADALRPSVQVAEQLAVALNIPEEEQPAFVRLARNEPDPSPLPAPQPEPEEIGQENLTGRAIRGYQLGEKIGAGGYGVVYRAVQATVERDVAVKIILPEFANRPEFIRRFEAEAQLVARLEHPHIVPLYDYWREPGVAYLVMRLLRGGSLEKALVGGPLPPDRVLSIMAQICAGLHIAHRAGVIHRDIKPANVLLDDDGNAYLADFGIAKITANIQALTEQTAEGTVIGSPAYIAPEQILAEPVKAQADIYSLGVMLYEMLAGRKPFPETTPVAFIQKHLSEALPLLPQNGHPAGEAESASPSIPTALDIVIARATAKNPADRYPNVVDLLEDLRQALSPDSTAADLAGSQRTEITPPHVAAMLDLPDLENPYKGLRPFTEADAADFFGRTTLIQDLLARMAEATDLARFLAVVGPSGSGKSSVVRAGLIPALRQGGVPGSDAWFITEMIPGSHPLEELAAALERVAIRPPADLLALLRADERGLLRAVRRILPADESVELVLVIDQFEELFTLVEEEAGRSHLLNSLVTATLEPDSRLRVVLTLRADFTDHPLRYVDFGELVRQRTEFVLPLTPDELEEAIVNPTRRAGLGLESGLVPAIVREIGDHPGMLPLLQYALTELFERRKGRLLTMAGYRESGGVLGALARRAEELYGDLDQAGQEMARQLFLRLVTLGEGTEDTRRRVARTELEALALAASPGEEEPAQAPASEKEAEMVMEVVIEQFGRYRLLTFDHDPLTRSPTVEVAHEALLREWRRLREWLDASRADVRLQRLLAAAAREWVEGGREEGYLLRGARLDQFEGWASQTALALTGAERAFLEASLTARHVRRTEEAARQRRELETAQKLAETEARRAAEQAQSARRLRWLAAGLALFLVAAVVAAWFAFNQSQAAQSNFETAERIRLAAQAQIALDNGEGGDLPALLALRSLQLGYSPEADAALLEAVGRGFTRQRYLGHTDVVAHVDFSPDGRYVLTAAHDHTARLWDAQTGRELRPFIGDASPVNGAAFSPDGRYIAMSGPDNPVRLFEVETGQEVRQLGERSPDLWGLSFSPDGRRLAAADGVLARLWEVETGRELRRFEGHTDTIFWVEFSPDGRSLVTASKDKTARLWEAATGQELRQLSGHTDTVSDGRFSPDSQYVLTTSFDRTARLWDVATGLEVRRFVGHTDFIYMGYFSPDGRYVVTGSNDKTARLWDVTTGQEVRQFIGHTAGVWPVTFSPDGRYVLTGSQDRTARLWDVWIETEPRTLSAPFTSHTAGLQSISLSPDGRFVLTAGGEGAVRLWDIETGDITHEITLEAVTINTQAFSQDNQYVWTGGGDGVARLWDIGSGEEVRQFSGHTGPLWDIALSPDGRTMLTAGEDGTARLWEIETGRELYRFTGHAGAVKGVAFSADDRYILTGGQDGAARLWEVETGREVRQFAGHTGPVQDVAFSPDGRTILTGSEDKTARLWEAESGREIRQFVGHTDQVARVAYAPDGRAILTGSVDQSARLWETETGRPVRELVGHTSPLLSVGFSADGQHILTGDTQSAYLWRAALEEVIDFTCAQLSRTLTAEERALYNITDNTAPCQEVTDRMATVEPTWTPVPTRAGPAPTLALAPAAQSGPVVIEMEFANEAANIQMGVPIQEAYIDAGDGQVVRPEVLNEETLALPVYRTAIEVMPDFLEAPFDTGPYPKGEPLGFTLADWIAATGRGTYTVQGNRAVIDLTFDNLIPNGLYTLWCSEFILPPNTKMIERPCGAPDGSENTFVAGADGHAEITMEIDAFPPPTAKTFYEIAAAYHSDGQTHGSIVGQHGLNAHGQIYYDFFAPEE